MNKKLHLATIGCNGLIIEATHTLNTIYLLFHSLGGNAIVDSGATALADVLRMIQSLRTLK